MIYLIDMGSLAIIGIVLFILIIKINYKDNPYYELFDYIDEEHKDEW